MIVLGVASGMELIALLARDTDAVRPHRDAWLSAKILALAGARPPESR